MSVSQYWCGTLNNPLTKDLPPVKGLKYKVWQLEVGKSGTPHLQIYVEFGTNQRLSAMTKWIPGCHWEVRKGTAKQASDYCKKKEGQLEGPWEFGTMSEPEQGKRNDLIEFREMAVVKSKQWMLNHYPVEMCKFWRVYEGLVENYMPRPVGKREVILCYGAPGTGKTAYARSMCPAEDMCVIPVSKDMWFNGVQGARVCVLDDYTGAFKLVDVLRLLHEYPERVAVKGGFTWWNPEVVVLTTNKQPMEWYEWAGREEQREALGRRFTKLLFFGDAKRDLSTLSPVPGCKAKWEHGPTLEECKQKNALANLMSGAMRDHVERKRKLGDDGRPQKVRRVEREEIDLRETQEVLPAKPRSYYEEQMERAMLLGMRSCPDSEEEGTGE